MDRSASQFPLSRGTLTESQVAPSQTQAMIYKYDRVLLKKDTLVGSVRCKDRQWYSCFVVLQGDQLLVYPPKMVVSRMNHIQPSMAIRLENALVLPQYYYKSSKRTILVIRLPDESSYFFQPQASSQIAGWICAFKEALHNMTELQIGRVRRQLEDSYHWMSEYHKVNHEQSQSPDLRKSQQTVQYDIASLTTRMASSIVSMRQLNTLTGATLKPHHQSTLGLFHPAATDGALSASPSLATASSRDHQPSLHGSTKADRRLSYLAHSPCSDQSLRSTTDSTPVSVEQQRSGITCSADSDVSSILESHAVSSLSSRSPRAPHSPLASLPSLPSPPSGSLNLNRSSVYTTPLPAVTEEETASLAAMPVSLRIQMPATIEAPCLTAGISQSLYNSPIDESSPVSICSFQSAISGPTQKSQPTFDAAAPTQGPLASLPPPPPPLPAPSPTLLHDLKASPLSAQASPILSPLSFQRQATMLKRVPSASTASGPTTPAASLHSQHSELLRNKVLKRKTPSLISIESKLSVESFTSQNAMYALQEIKSSLKVADNRLDSCRDQLQVMSAQVSPVLSPNEKQTSKVDNEESPDLMSELQLALFKRKCKQQQMIETLKKSRSRDELL